MKENVELTLPAPFVLASLLMSYPESNIGEYVTILLKDEKINLPNEIKEIIQKYILKNDIQDLQSEYIDIFDRGRDQNPLYETEFDRSRAMSKGQDLGDIAGFYKAFGFDIDSDVENLEMLDHVSIEMEFYALLLMKQQYNSENNNQEAIDSILDGRKKFLRDHLGRFLTCICDRPGVQASEFYSSIFKWGNELISSECKKLGIEVIPAVWFSQPSPMRNDEMECGAILNNINPTSNR